MRKPLSVLAAAALAGTMVVTLSGTAFAAGNGGSAKPVKVTTCQVKSATAGITAAMALYLAGIPAGGSPATALKYIDQGSKIAASYQASQQVDTAAGLTSATQLTQPTAVKVKCNGKTKANFQYSIFLKDKTTGTTTAPLTTASGDALIKNGHWYVSASTVCDLNDGAISAVSDPTLKQQITQAVSNCYTAIGQTLPPAS